MLYVQLKIVVTFVTGGVWGSCVEGLDYKKDFWN